jgi:hypothetical protein
MKLYAWKPREHGQYSFFVCAENEKDAKDAVDSYIKEHKNKNDDESISDYSSRGFGTDYYFLTVLEPLQVVNNCND